MKHLFYFSTLSLIYVASAFAQRIETSDSVIDIYYRGVSEQVGSVSMAIYGDVFGVASKEAPVFIEMKFDRGEALAHTLVEMNGEDPLLQQPIYLALQLSTEDETAQLQAPGDAVSVVRWVKGESSLWLRVQSSSSSWVSQDGEVRPPGEQEPVEFLLGVSAARMVEIMDAVPNQHKNLPFNTRNSEQALEEGPENAVSNLMCLDLSNSDLASSGMNALIEYGISAHGSAAQQSPGVYDPVSPVNIDFRGNFVIGRGKDKRCEITPSSTPRSMCLEEPDSGRQSMESVLTLGIACQTGGGFTEGFLTDGAILTLTTKSNAYGFAENGAWFNGDTPGTAQLSDPFDTEIGTLYRQVDLRYNGPFQRLEDYELQIGVRLEFEGSAPDMDLLLTLSLTLNHGAEMEPPLTALDQAANCGASPFLAGSGLWHVGTWGCGLSNGLLFPHVTRANGGFSTALLVANTTSEPTEYALSVYDVTGQADKSLSGRLNANETRVYDASHFQLTDGGYLSGFGSDAVAFSAAYQAGGQENGPAHLGPSERKSSAWRLYPGNEDLTWDGVAMVNTGTGDAQISVLLKNLAGETLEVVDLGATAAGEKQLVLLTRLFEQSTNGAYYVIRSSEPLALMALRGAWSGAFLWENKAIPTP